MNNFKILVYLLFLTLLLSCQSRLLTVHKIDVQQGNALDAEMVDKIEIGMSREQVQFVLGSPLITDSFHPDRWDYLYLFTPGYGEQERRQLTLTFDRNEVIEINRHNIVKSNVANTSTDDEKGKDKTEEEKLSAQDQKELEELEKQAETLEEVLDENNNLDN